MAAPKPRAIQPRKPARFRPARAAKGGTRGVKGRLLDNEYAPLIAMLMNQHGFVAVDKVADAFGMSKGQLAETIGLSREALYKLARLDAPKTQTRLKEMLEIISRVVDWAGGKQQAMGWYRAQPIAAFGGRTAEALIKDGQAGALRDYLDHIALGGFA
jgi:DNA-binding XRE family transcriptional regulator